VDALDGAGMAGELMSWLGLILGLPLLLVALPLRAGERGLVPTEIVIVRDGRTARARWYAAGEFHERELLRHERGHVAGQDFIQGYVGRRDPWVMRLERRTPVTSVLLVLGATLVALGLAGFALSFLPQVVA
jgi:hypothetical protein